MCTACNLLMTNEMLAITIEIMNESYILYVHNS